MDPRCGRRSAGAAAVFVGRFGRGDRGGGGGGVRSGGPAGGGRANDPAQLEEAQRRARQTELARFTLVWLLTVDGPGRDCHRRSALTVRPMCSKSPRSLVRRRGSSSTGHALPLMITWQGPAPQLMVRGRQRGAAQAAMMRARGDGPRRSASRPRCSSRSATTRRQWRQASAPHYPRRKRHDDRGVDDRQLPHQPVVPGGRLYEMTRTWSRPVRFCCRRRPLPSGAARAAACHRHGPDRRIDPMAARGGYGARRTPVRRRRERQRDS